MKDVVVRILSIKGHALIPIDCALPVYPADKISFLLPSDVVLTWPMAGDAVDSHPARARIIIATGHARNI